MLDHDHAALDSVSYRGRRDDHADAGGLARELAGTLWQEGASRSSSLARVARSSAIGSRVTGQQVKAVA
jgi:hypothetical protein